jgi:hypothetical protein
MEEAERRILALAAAAFLELSIDPAMLAGVADNLALLQSHASNVMSFPLPAEEEIAAVFAT